MIGAGAGGAAVAGALAAAGRRVTIIEAGPSRSDWPNGHVCNLDPSESGLVALEARLNEYLVWPSEAASAPPGLAGARVAHGVGGMFGLWTCNCPWPHRYELPPWSDPDVWFRYLRLAHDLLHVQDDFGASGVRMKALLERIRRAVGPTVPGREVKPMPVAVRQGPDGLVFSSIPNLLERGGSGAVEIVSDLIVHQILHRGGRGLGVLAHGREDRSTVRIEADVVVLAAGALGTPKILAASDIDAGPALGRGFYDHPAFASRVALQTEIAESIPTDDPMVTIWAPFSPEHPWHNQLCRFPGRPNLYAPDVEGADSIDIFTWIPMDIDFDNRLQFDRDRLDPFGLPEVSAQLRLSLRDRRRAEAGLAEHFAIASEIGDLSRGWFPAFYKPGEASHLMGSCRMGPKDDGDSVVDAEGKLWRYDNIFIAGNVVLAQTNGGNPSLTSIAAALRCADAIINQGAGSGPTTTGETVA